LMALNESPTMAITAMKGCFLKCLRDKGYRERGINWEGFSELKMVGLRKHGQSVILDKMSEFREWNGTVVLHRDQNITYSWNCGPIIEMVITRL
jgi:hypothetical protein